MTRNPVRTGLRGDPACMHVIRLPTGVCAFVTRAYDGGHVAQACRLVNANYAAAYPPSQHIPEGFAPLEEGDFSLCNLFVVFARSGEMVATFSLEKHHDHVMLRRFARVADPRFKGLGKELLRCAAELARGLPLRARVYAHAPALVNFYLRSGFTEYLALQSDPHAPFLQLQRRHH